jgi:hypothetical protein
MRLRRRRSLAGWRNRGALRLRIRVRADGPEGTRGEGWKPGRAKGGEAWFVGREPGGRGWSEEMIVA